MNHSQKKVKEFTQLHWASMNGDHKLIRKLLRLGESVNARAMSGFTPLIIAAGEGHLEAVRVLLDAGAHINARNPAQGYGTAFITACVWGKADVVAELMRRGARLSIKDDDGHTGYDHAVLNKRWNVIRVLKAAKQSATKSADAQTKKKSRRRGGTYSRATPPF